MRIYVRYDTPISEDDENSTRRVKYEQMGELEVPPELVIPTEGLYLWGWYLDMSVSVTRIRDGLCSLIAPSEITAWSQLTGNVMNSFEYQILRAMDLEYCSETNKELSARRSKQADDDRRESEQHSRSSKGRRR